MVFYDDDFDIISEADVYPDATKAYDDGTDDFVAIGRPLSYAHSLRCGMPESTAAVFYFPAVESEDYDDEFPTCEDEDEDSDEENENSRAEYTRTTYDAASEITKAALPTSVSPSPPSPCPAVRILPSVRPMNLRLVDAQTELAARLSGTLSTARPPHSRQQGGEEDGQSENAVELVEESGMTREELDSSATTPTRLLIMACTEWWERTMIRAVGRVGDLGTVVDHLVDRGILAATWVETHLERFAVDYWKIMDETAHRLRVLIMDGTRLPWRATLGQRREMARRATTRGLAQILDLAPVAGSLWDMRNGGSYDYYDLVYLGSPTRPGTASLRLALVFASDPPKVPTAPAPPHDRSG